MPGGAFADLHAAGAADSGAADSDRRPGHHDLHLLFRALFQWQHFGLLAVDGQGYDLLKKPFVAAPHPDEHPAVHAGDRACRSCGVLPGRTRHTRHEPRGRTDILRFPRHVGILQRRILQSRWRTIQPAAAPLRPERLHNSFAAYSRRRHRIPDTDEFQPGRQAAGHPRMEAAAWPASGPTQSTHSRLQHKNRTCHIGMDYRGKLGAVFCIRVQQHPGRDEPLRQNRAVGFQFIRAPVVGLRLGQPGIDDECNLDNVRIPYVGRGRIAVNGRRYKGEHIRHYAPQPQGLGMRQPQGHGLPTHNRHRLAAHGARRGRAVGARLPPYRLPAGDS